MLLRSVWAGKSIREMHSAKDIVREKLAEASVTVGYGVASVLWDHDNQHTQEMDLATYYMHRKDTAPFYPALRTFQAHQNALAFQA